MKNLIRSLIILLPLFGIYFFFNILTEEKFYPGADFRSFEVPNFELSALDLDVKYTSEDFDNEFLMNVWASWCITCRVEHGFLMKLNNDGYNIVGLNYKDNKSDALGWLKKYTNPYSLNIHDPKGSLTLDMGVTGAPETFLVKDGIVLVHYSGEVNKVIWDNVFVPIIKENKMFQ